MHFVNLQATALECVGVKIMPRSNFVWDIFFFHIESFPVA
jgi:hypothetical protein